MGANELQRRTPPEVLARDRFNEWMRSLVDLPDDKRKGLQGLAIKELQTTLLGHDPDQAALLTGLTAEEKLALQSSTIGVSVANYDAFSQLMKGQTDRGLARTVYNISYTEFGDPVLEEETTFYIQGPRDEFHSVIRPSAAFLNRHGQNGFLSNETVENIVKQLAKQGLTVVPPLSYMGERIIRIVRPMNGVAQGELKQPGLNGYKDPETQTFHKEDLVVEITLGYPDAAAKEASDRARRKGTQSEAEGTLDFKERSAPNGHIDMKMNLVRRGPGNDPYNPADSLSYDTMAAGIDNPEIIKRVVLTYQDVYSALLSSFYNIAGTKPPVKEVALRAGGVKVPGGWVDGEGTVHIKDNGVYEAFRARTK